MARFIEDGEKPTVYDSILVSPEKLSIFGSVLSLRIVKELAKNPGCAMDLSRKLEQHEQKIYYHLRNLEGAGIIKQIRTEQRYGMTAKIFDVVSPVVATKLYNDGYEIKNEREAKDPKILRFLHPFVKDGKLDAKIVIGWSYPHGKYEYSGLDAGYAVDIALFFGSVLDKPEFPCYKVDTKVNEKDMKGNLILIGNPKTNTIIDELNPHLPLYFNNDNEWAITSRISGKTYTDDFIGMVLITENPLNKKKKILILGGKRSRGTVAAMIAFTQNFDHVVSGNINDKNQIAKVFVGRDNDGDELIDSVKFLE